MSIGGGLSVFSGSDLLPEGTIGKGGSFSGTVGVDCSELVIVLLGRGFGGAVTISEGASLGGGSDTFRWFSLPLFDCPAFRSTSICFAGSALLDSESLALRRVKERGCPGGC
jgi:hypothetical protein